MAWVVVAERRSHLENMELKAEYTRLQESYRELERMKDSLEDKKATCQLNLTDAQKEAEKTRTEVRIFTSECTCIHLITVYCKKNGGMVEVGTG